MSIGTQSACRPGPESCTGTTAREPLADNKSLMTGDGERALASTASARALGDGL